MCQQSASVSQGWKNSGGRREGERMKVGREDEREGGRKKGCS